MKEYLTLTNIDFSYNNSQFILSDINLTIEKKSFTVLLGKNGSGKSTILNLIAGFRQPDAGTLFLDKNNITVLPPNQRNIGMVIQNENLFPHLTVWGNLEFGLKVRKINKKTRTIDISRVLEQLDLTDKKKSLPDELSGGEKQRVAIARLILRNAKLWLLDEPLSNLDPIYRPEIRRIIKENHELNDVTTIYVTHDADEALALSDKIIFLDQGKIIQHESPENIFDFPGNLDIARFFGIPENNLIFCELVRENNNLQIYCKELNYYLKITIHEGSSNFPSEFIMALRPDSFMVNDSNSTMCGEIRNKEFLGRSYNINLLVNRKNIFIALNRDNKMLSANIRIGINYKKLICYGLDGNLLLEFTQFLRSLS